MISKFELLVSYLSRGNYYETKEYGRIGIVRKKFCVIYKNQMTGEDVPLFFDVAMDYIVEIAESLTYDELDKITEELRKLGKPEMDGYIASGLDIADKASQYNLDVHLINSSKEKGR